MVKNSYILDSTLALFRFLLLKKILFTSFFFAFFVATLSIVDIFPLGTIYTNVLYGYSFINLIVFYLFKKLKIHYFSALNMALFFSLIMFTVMSLTLLDDEFRFVWFFLISFSSFILGGKYYGFSIAFIIAFIVLYIYFFLDVNLSLYALLTFFSALFVFNIFAYYFLKKIENDEMYLESRIEEEVEKQQEQEQILLQKYRMANMGEMIDSIAHQWRQPLMQSNMMLLNMSESLDDKLYLEKKIEELSRLNSHMSQTIDDFRNLLKDGKSKSSFSVSSAIDEVLLLLKNNLRDVELSYERKEFELLSYKNEFMQVMITLISNALEALEGIEPKHLIIEISKVDKMLYVEVEDNAGGIEPTIMEKIFDPYFTTKEQSGGTGLGLYIAKIIVEQNLNGRINVENTKKGAKFTLVLPIEG